MGEKRKMGVPQYREQVSEVLSECFSQNLLDLEELERRQDLIQKADTIEDLDLIIADAPANIRNALTVPQKVSKPTSIVEFRRKEKTAFCMMGSRNLRGRNLESQETNAITLMGETVADFRDLELPEKPLVLNIVNVMGSTHIIVNPETPVDFEVLTIMGESKEGRKVNSLPAPDRQGIIIRGLCVMGEVKVIGKD